ncbi:hypothetical protein V6N13_099755 [Hibiscus sabdariffa]|uniref:Uncharacterized protein n=1 Tax=Hibiscus sabdariffa TaxID=183260 RepID=A0ABR2NM31_9ROSI
MRFINNQAKTPISLELASMASMLYHVLLISSSCVLKVITFTMSMDTHPLIKTYPEIGEHAFGYKQRAIVFVLCSCMSSCTRRSRVPDIRR